MKKYCVVVIVLFSVLFQTNIEASPSGVENFRLPFDTTSLLDKKVSISQGPRCPEPNGSHNSSSSRSNEEAIDFSLEEEHVLVAPMGGEIFYKFEAAANSDSYAGGNILLILHDNGLKSIFAHLNAPSNEAEFQSLFSVGDNGKRSVSKGQYIAKSGNSGNVGAHLHFAVVKSDRSDVIDGEPVPIWQIPGLTWFEKDANPNYPSSGNCVFDGQNDGYAQWPPPGEKRLELERFTLERTNPKVGEDMQFEAVLKNTGEVPIALDVVFVRLRRNGETDIEVHAQNMGVVTILSGERRAFSLRGPPITVNGLWKIHKVEAHAQNDPWFTMREINGHIMIGFPSLVKDHPVTVSSVRNGNVGQFAVDGNHRTRWESSLNDNQTLEIDLGQVLTIDSILVRSDWAYPKWFKVEYSTGGEWNLLVDDVAGRQDNSTFIPLGDTQVSKLKFTFKERGTKWAHAIWEIEVYDLVDGCPALARCTSPATATPVQTATSVVTAEPTPVPGPTHTPQPNPTATPTSGPVDTILPEGHIVSPTDGTFVGTGWFEVTAYATDYQSGVKKVEFHFYHDGVWHMVYEDWSGSDGWKASVDTTGFWAQNDMKLLLWIEDNAGNRIQSNVISALTNVPVATPTETSVSTPTRTSVPTPTSTRTVVPTPTSTKTPMPTPTNTPVTDPMSGVISGTIVDEKGIPASRVDVWLFRDTQESVYWVKWVEDGTFVFDGLPYSTWIVQVEEVSDNDMWEEVEPHIVVINQDISDVNVTFNLTQKQIPMFKVFVPFMVR